MILKIPTFVFVIAAIILIGLIITIFSIKSKKDLKNIRDEVDFDRHDKGIDPYDPTESSNSSLGFNKPPDVVSELPKFQAPQKVYLYQVFEAGEEGQYYEKMAEYKSLREAERETNIKRYKIKKSCNEGKLIDQEGTKILFSFTPINN